MFETMCEALHYKVSHIGVALRNTRDRIIAECTERDLVWGTGVKLSSPEALIRSRWKGGNLLGRAWMQVRSDLRTEEEKKLEGTQIIGETCLTSPQASPCINHIDTRVAPPEDRNRVSSSTPSREITSPKETIVLRNRFELFTRPDGD